MAEEEKIREHAKQALQALTNKTEKWKDRMKDFLWEVFIILVAVNITIWFHNWNDKRHEKRDMTLYLNAIKFELEENIKIIDSEIESLQGSERYANYLQSHDKKSLNADTISSYASDYGTVPVYQFKTNAFEMFKNSGFMRIMDSKELLLVIWDTYAKLDELKLTLDECTQMKKDNIRTDIQLLAEGTPHIPVYSFYISNLPHKMPYNCEETSKILKETVEKLEETLKK